MCRAQPLLTSPPTVVRQQLRAGQETHIREKAWLLLFYSIILSHVSSKTPDDHDTKRKLRANIWMTLHDARLLLEPSEINIQALIMLASHVEEFSTPSLCWMLTTNACRMLQALGVNHRRLSPETRERRRLMFWHLNLVDTGLALCFGRPPTFHRAMSKEIEVPSLTQLRTFQPHKDGSQATSLFGAHYIHQMFLCSRIVGDIWYCLYDGDPPDDDRIRRTIRAMEAWYKQALEVSKRVRTSIEFGSHLLLDPQSRCNSREALPGQRKYCRHRSRAPYGRVSTRVLSGPVMPTVAEYARPMLRFFDQYALSLTWHSLRLRGSVQWYRMATCLLPFHPIFAPLQRHCCREQPQFNFPHVHGESPELSPRNECPKFACK